MTDAVIQADFSDFRQVKSRKVAQLIFEIPLEALPQAMERLGWPKPGESLPVAIARLAVAPERQEARHKLSQTAYLYCNRSDFQAWLGCNTLELAKAKVYEHCSISSLSELDTNEIAETYFKALAFRFEKDWTKKQQAPRLG
jgi:hypothetical protein